MPSLPTFNVSDAQAQRLLAAFGSEQAYLNWLKEQIVGFVVEQEQRVFEQNVVEQRRGISERVRKELGV